MDDGLRRAEERTDGGVLERAEGIGDPEDASSSQQWLSSGSRRKSVTFTNDKTGFKALLKWIGGAEGLRIVYEPTGPYHRGTEEALAKAGHALVKVNPRRARRFAEATGTQAKMDRVDAMLLARMGLALDLPPPQVRDELMNELKELHVARLALIKDRTAAGNRADTAAIGPIRRQAKAPNLAITAVMRKLVLLANALLRDGRKQTDRPA